jgi:FKBP-type peptidyl-prolyl cis-trans isomerase
MNTKQAANKALSNAYRGGVEKAIADRDKRTGAYTHRQSILIPAEETERRRAEAAAWEVRMQAQEAEQAREQAEAAEADFRADEKQKYLAAGGSEFDFNMNWSRLRAEIVEERWRNAPDRSTSGAAKRHLDLLYGKRD